MEALRVEIAEDLAALRGFQEAARQPEFEAEHEFIRGCIRDLHARRAQLYARMGALCQEEACRN